jgi:hypothetical protein
VNDIEENKNLIAYCGLYCGDCSGYQGKIADLARDLRKELRRVKFDLTAEFMSTLSFFQVFKYYPQCYDVLGAMVKLRCKNACRGGGGNPSCKIRNCSQKKGYEGCWECVKFETCEKLKFLKANHGDAHIKNLKKIARNGPEAFIKGKRLWYSPVKEKVSSKT